MTHYAISRLEELLAKSEAFDANKRDIEARANEFQITGSGIVHQPKNSVSFFGGMNVQVAEEPYELTDYAFGQLLGRLSPTLFGRGANKTMAKDSFDALRRRFPDLWASVANGLLENTEGKFLLRTHEQDARALLSSRYAIYQNTHVMRTLVDVLAPEADSIPNLKVCGRSYLGPDSMNVYIEFDEGERPDGSRSTNFRVGVYMANNEIGGGSMTVAPFIKRMSCDNSILIQSDQAVRMRHTGDSRVHAAQVKVSMLAMLPLAQEALDRIYDAELEEIPSFQNVLRGMKKDKAWSDKLYDNIMIGTEGATTRQGIVNGLAYAAKSIESPDDRAALELEAGRILVAPDSLFAKAARMGEEVAASTSRRPTSRYGRR